MVSLYLNNLEYCQKARQRAGHSGQRIGTQAAAVKGIVR